MMPALDIAASRARILAPAAQAQGFAYRDNDAPTMAPAAPRPVPAPRSGAFVDLDASPLEIAGAAAQNLAPAPTQGHDACRTAPAVAQAAPEQASPAPVPGPAPAPTPAKLTPALMRRILYVATTPAGQPPAYGRCQANLDGQGLRYGLGRFTQASGDLGRLLKEMQAADPAAFAATFGPAEDFPEADPQALLAVTNTLPAAPGGVGADLPQLQPVSGKLVWSKEWITRFKAAAKVPAFQAVQFKTTAQVYLLPILPLAKQLRLNSEKGLAMMVERVIHMGQDRALTAILQAISPLKTDAMRTAALAHVAPGQTIAEFQRAHGLPDVLGTWEVRTHIKVLELLGLDQVPPIPLPDYAQMSRDMLDFFLRDEPSAGFVVDIARNAALSMTQIDVSAPDMGDGQTGGTSE